jgi:hypothetical protein
MLPTLNRTYTDGQYAKTFKYFEQQLLAQSEQHNYKLPTGQRKQREMPLWSVKLLHDQLQCVASLVTRRAT